MLSQIVSIKMKKIGKPLIKKYRVLKLYLEDLETIEEVIIQNGGSLKIQAGELEFDNISELHEKYKNNILNDLTIKATGPHYAVIRLEKSSANLGGNSLDIGIFHAIDSILTARQSRPTFLYSFWTLIIGVAIFFFVSFFLKESLVTIKIPLIILFVILYLWLFITGRCRNSRITLARKGDVKSFLARNKDWLVKIVISAVLVFCVQRILTILF